jgi:hypothetical protein
MGNKKHLALLKVKTAPKWALCHGDALFLDLLDDGRTMNSILTIFQVILQSLGPMTLGSMVM